VVVIAGSVTEVSGCRTLAYSPMPAASWCIFFNY